MKLNMYEFAELVVSVLSVVTFAAFFRKSSSRNQARFQMQLITTALALLGINEGLAGLSPSRLSPSLASPILLIVIFMASHRLGRMAQAAA